MKKTCLYAIIFIVVDYISKILISKLITLNKSITIINKFLYITYVRNTGAAFSIFSNYTYVLAIISLLVIALILYYVYKRSNLTNLEYLSYSLLLGGACGNLIDRLIYGYVIDFIDVKIFKYDFPVFNLADSFIVISFIILIILEIKKDKLVKKEKK